MRMVRAGAQAAAEKAARVIFVFFMMRNHANDQAAN
jgi:hypothetical protein